MDKNKTMRLNLGICSMVFLTSMAFFFYANYIDLSVIKAIYLPIYLIIVLAILFKQSIFSYIFTSSAVIGLLLEYFIHRNSANPNMRAAFLNTIILFIGAILGVIIQLFLRGRRKERY